MERSPAEVALVVREGVLHERDQRRDQGGARRDQGPAHSLRESALIAAEVLDELLRRGRAHGLGVNRMVRVVHHVLLYSVRRAPRGTVVRATPRPVSGHRWSLVECCIEHTLAHGAHPPQAFVEPSAIARCGHGTHRVTH